MSASGYISTALGNLDLSNLFQNTYTNSSNTILTNYYTNSVSQVYVTFSVGTVLASSGFLQNGVDISTLLQPVAGEHVYKVAGTYTWKCPPYVKSVCIICVGSGADGTTGAGVSTPGTAGALSNFKNGATVVCQANGGGKGTTLTGGAGGTVGTGTGGAGGAGALRTSGNGGAGGAGGYSGTGGAGGTGTVAPTAGTGGGGGGGGSNATGGFSGSAGGVNIYGSGTNGAAGVNSGTPIYGGGGSGGANGNTGLNVVSGGAYGGGCFTFGTGSGITLGGGGGGALSYVNAYTTVPGNTYTVIVGLGGYLYYTTAPTVVYATGGVGAVRILWGNGRSFPSTQVGTAFNSLIN